MTFELKPLVGASLSEEAIREVNEAMAILVAAKLTDNGTTAKLALQRHLFDLVPTRHTEDDD